MDDVVIGQLLLIEQLGARCAISLSYTLSELLLWRSTQAPARYDSPATLSTTTLKAIKPRLEASTSSVCRSFKV
jgi:hypothetical protein